MAGQHRLSVEAATALAHPFHAVQWVIACPSVDHKSIVKNRSCLRIFLLAYPSFKSLEKACKNSKTHRRHRKWAFPEALACFRGSFFDIFRSFYGVKIGYFSILKYASSSHFLLSITRLKPPASSRSASALQLLWVSMNKQSVRMQHSQRGARSGWTSSPLRPA